MLAVYLLIAGIIAVIFFKFILYFVVAFISYMITIAVDKKPFAQMIIVVTALLILQLLVVEIDKKKDEIYHMTHIGISQNRE